MAHVAGGDAADVRSPHPNDEYLLTFGPFTVKTNKDSGVIADCLEVPFACKPVRCEVIARYAKITSQITIAIKEDSTSSNLMKSGSHRYNLYPSNT